jgi:hypothetical protein
MSDLPQPRKPVVTRNYLATGCSPDVVANYRTLREVDALLKTSASGPLRAHRVAHLYTDDNFNQHCVFHASDVKTAADGKPALWVITEFRRGDVDVAALDAQLAKYGLQLHHQFEEEGFWQ